MTKKELIKIAIANINKSYAPYSGYNVSAALLTVSGNVYKGGNIENSSYSMTICAERTAFFSAVLEGEREFEMIVIIGGRDGKIEDYCPPCGACRQVMREFCKDDFKIILAKSEDEYKEYTLIELLPESFSSDNLRKEDI